MNACLQQVPHSTQVAMKVWQDIFENLALFVSDLQHLNLAHEDAAALQTVISNCPICMHLFCRQADPPDTPSASCRQGLQIAKMQQTQILVRIQPRLLQTEPPRGEGCCFLASFLLAWGRISYKARKKREGGESEHA